jgi:hypothetical protein
MNFNALRHSSEFDRVLAALKPGNMSQSPVILDDGAFLIERSVGADGVEHGGRLLSRRAQDQDIPGVLKSCGEYVRLSDDTWQTYYTSSGQRIVSDAVKTRDEAVTLLWFVRIHL